MAPKLVSLAAPQGGASIPWGGPAGGSAPKLASLAAPQTWVFLRGLTRSSAHWGHFIAEFEAALSARVIALDLPGNGWLWQERSASSVTQMAQGCQQELQRRGINEPVGVLAMSLGGMVAAQWALQQPQAVRELVLINTSMRPFNPFWQRLRTASFFSLLKLALTGATAQGWEREILRLTTNHARHDVLQDWCEERMQRPVSALNAMRQLVAAARYRAQMPGPQVPTLVLAGAHDRLVAVQCSKELAQRWCTALQLHPSAGHDLTLDDGPWVADAVLRWRDNRQAAA
jgi:pimeloyl-ACP methyl ester carboxylesterase